MIVNSNKYARYLITSIESITFKEEKTKVHVAYILNEDNPNQPTRIIGLGATEGGVWSWKNVAHIHISDIAASSIKDDSGLFAAAFSRLANSNGTMLIESPPRGPRGTLYQIYTKSKLGLRNVTDKEEQEGQFKVYEVTAREAVQAGLIKQEFLEAEKRRLGTLYRQYYEASFVASIFAAFDIDKIEKATALGANCMPSQMGFAYTPRSIGIDPGFGSSNFALTIMEDASSVYYGKKLVLYSKQHPRATYEEMVELSYSLAKAWDIDSIYVDAANPEFIRSLKVKIGENHKFEEIQQQAKKDNIKLENIMKVIPVPFQGLNGKMLLQHCKMMIETEQIGIHPDKFNELLDELRIAQEVDGNLDKTEGNQLDLLDSFRLACWFWRLDEN